MKMVGINRIELTAATLAELVAESLSRGQHSLDGPITVEYEQMNDMECTVTFTVSSATET